MIAPIENSLVYLKDFGHLGTKNARTVSGCEQETQFVIATKLCIVCIQNYCNVHVEPSISGLH